MSSQQLNANQIVAAYANQMFAYLAAQQAVPAPRPALNANQAAIVEAVDSGITCYAKLGRKVGMTKRQVQCMAQGLLFAGVLISTNGVLAVA